jgi:hypothetical protein
VFEFPDRKSIPVPAASNKKLKVFSFAGECRSCHPLDGWHPHVYVS